MVRIPSEYQEVEYIESTKSGQYIDTEITISEDLTFILDFQPSIYRASKYLMGKYVSDDGTFYMFFGQAGYFQTAFGSNWKNTILRSDKNRHKFTYRFANETLFVECNNDVILSTPINYKTSLPIYVAGYAGGASSVGCKTYSSQIFRNGIIIQNLIPCYNKSSGEIGMYDTVSKQFYTNSGTGTFLKGNDVTYDNINLLESRRRILLNTPHIETVSDTVASFKTDVATNLKECKIHFTPIQEGEGDPSPDNVRPITGWDGVTLYLSGSDTSNPTTLTIPFPQTIYGGYVDLVKGEVVETHYSFIMDGENYYPTSARQVNTSGCGIAYDIIGNNKFSGLPRGKQGTANKVICDNVPAIIGNWKKLNKNCVQCGDSGGFLYLRLAVVASELEDVSSASAIGTSLCNWLKNNQIRVLYVLATPNIYPIDPQTLKALRGMNNIWSDANGNIEVSYYTH